MTQSAFRRSHYTVFRYRRAMLYATTVERSGFSVRHEPTFYSEKKSHTQTLAPLSFSLLNQETQEYCNYGARFITAGMYHMSATLHQGFKTCSQTSAHLVA